MLALYLTARIRKLTQFSGFFRGDMKRGGVAARSPSFGKRLGREGQVADEILKICPRPQWFQSRGVGVVLDHAITGVGSMTKRGHGLVEMPCCLPSHVSVNLAAWPLIKVERQARAIAML